MRRTPLLAKAPVDRSREPGYREWREPVRGFCACCGRLGPLERHHVVALQTVRRENAALCWDLRNSLQLGRYCRCHSRHTTATRRLPLSLVPEPAVAFAVELLGEASAADYLARLYSSG